MRCSRGIVIRLDETKTAVIDDNDEKGPKHNDKSNRICLQSNEISPNHQSDVAREKALVTACRCHVVFLPYVLSDRGKNAVRVCIFILPPIKFRRQTTAVYMFCFETRVLRYDIVCMIFNVRSKTIAYDVKFKKNGQK